jgi:hypothetical protein
MLSEIANPGWVPPEQLHISLFSTSALSALVF